MKIGEYFENMIKYHVTDDLTMSKAACMKLSDFLEPLNKVLKDGIMLETEGKMDVGIYDKDDIDYMGSSLMTVSYPFPTPCRPDLLEKKFEDLTDNEINDWVSGIQDRFSPLIRNAMPIDIVQEVDHTENLSCILHAYDGAIDLYKPNMVEDILCYTINDSIPSIFEFYNQLKTLKRDDPMHAAFSQFIQAAMHSDMSRMVYQFNYRNKSGDGLLPHGHYGMLTNVPLPMDNFIAWGAYIHCLKKFQPKVIFLP